MIMKSNNVEVQTARGPYLCCWGAHKCSKRLEKRVKLMQENKNQPLRYLKFTVLDFDTTKHTCSMTLVSSVLYAGSLLDENLGGQRWENP